MKTLKLIVSFFLLINSIAFAGEGDGTGYTTETSKDCQLIDIITPELRGEGDGSSMQPEYILVCQEVEKI